MHNSKSQKRIIRILALLIVALVVLFSFTACSTQKASSTEQAITSIYDLNDKTVGIAIGTMHEDIVEQYIPDCTIHYYNSIADLGVALNSGLVDGIIVDGAVSLALVKENKNFALVGDTFSTDEYDFAARVIVKQDEAEDQTFKEMIYDTFIAEGRADMFLNGIKTTAIISISSILIGGITGFVYIAYCWSKPTISLAARIGKKFVWIVKATPILVLLMILYYVVFASSTLSAVTVSIIAFSISFMASTESTLHHGIKSLNSGEEDAALSLGYTTWQIFFRFTAPQMLKAASEDIKNNIVELIQATSIVGYIAVQDITKVSDIVRGRTFDAFFPLLVTTVIYFLICWLVVAHVRLIEFKFNPRRRTPDEILKGVEHK